MNYHNITKEDMLNGDGLRVVLWVAGCCNYCKGCHNQITWDPNGGLLFDTNAENELFEALSKSYISGITFSGGDPLYPGNRQEILRLAKRVRRQYPHKSIWLYTGYLWDNVKDLEIMSYIDVLCEGPFVEELKDNNAHWVGSSNQRVIDVKKSLESGKVILHC